MESKKTISTKMNNFIKEQGKGFFNLYGILGLVSVVAVALKLLLFYQLIGVTVNLILIWMITCGFMISLFTSFKNKWIPTLIFVMISILMFADVACNSFFNRYVSVVMLGSAGLLGDVTESIKAVLRPSFFLLFLDIPLLLFTLIGATKKRRKRKTTRKMRQIEIKDGGEKAESKSGTLPIEIKRVIKLAINVVVLLTVILALALNPLNNSLVMSINSQELITYHIKDLLSYSEADQVKADSSYYLSTGTYEKTMTGGFNSRAGQDLFGAAKGKNLIVIQVESFQNMVINREYNGQVITPNLNALMKEQGTLYFDNYYQQIGSGNTSDAEFATNNSLLGSIESYTYQLFQDNYMKGLPWILKDQGYTTSAMHGFEKSFWNRENFYPTEGFDTFYSSDQFVNDKIKGLGSGDIVGISDHAFYEQGMEYMKEMYATGQPFYNFMITLSSHNPFGVPASLSRIEILPEDQDTLFGNYMASAAYADETLGELITQLKESGMYDDTVIAIYGDHFGLTKSDVRIEKRVSEWLGYPYDYDTMLNIPLFIHVPQSQVNGTISISGGQMDLMPTLAYLLGIEKLDTLYLGQNLLTAESGFVIEQTHMLRGSFIKDDIVFEISRDGVFEKSKAWNRKTRKELDIKPLKADSQKAKDLVGLSEFYLKNNVLKSAIVEHQNINDIVGAIGTEVKKEKKISLVETSTNENLKNKISLDDFFLWMDQKNKKARVMVSRSNLPEGLLALEKSFSGISGEPGDIKYVDPKVNGNYIDVKKRIIPVIENITDATKVDYLGYENMAFKPDLDRYTKEEIINYITINKPYAIVLPADEIISRGQYILDSGVFVYAYGADTLSKRAICNAIGVDGYIDEIMTDLDQIKVK